MKRINCKNCFKNFVLICDKKHNECPNCKHKHDYCENKISTHLVDITDNYEDKNKNIHTHNHDYDNINHLHDNDEE